MYRHVWETQFLNDDPEDFRCVMICSLCKLTEHEADIDSACKAGKAEGAEDQPRQKDPRAREPTPNRREDPT